MDCVRRCGVPDAGALHGADAGRSSATGSTAGRRRPRPGPNLDELHEIVRFFDRWLQGHRERRRRGARRSSGSSASTPSRSRSRRRCPGRWRAATRLSASRGRARDVARSRRRAAARRAARRGAGRGAPAADAGVDRYRHRPTVGTRAALSWGAGGPPNGLARDLRPDEALGPTYTTDAARRARSRSSACPRSCSTCRRPRPVATRRRPADRRRARRHVGPGQRRDPQPDPSPVARPTRRRSSRAGSRRSGSPLRPAGYRFLPGHRIRVSRGLVGVAGDSGRRRIAADLRAPPRPGDAVAPRPAGHPARRRPGRRARAGVQDDAAGPAGGRRRGQRRPAGLAHHRRRHRRDGHGHGPRRRRGRARRRPPAVRRRDAGA